MCAGTSSVFVNQPLLLPFPILSRLPRIRSAPSCSQSASAQPRWFLGFLGVEAEETLIYCISAQPPSFGHPSVANWYCEY